MQISFNIDVHLLELLAAHYRLAQMKGVEIESMSDLMTSVVTCGNRTAGTRKRSGTIIERIAHISRGARAAFLAKMHASHYHIDPDLVDASFVDPEEVCGTTTSFSLEDTLVVDLAAHYLILCFKGLGVKNLGDLLYLITTGGRRFQGSFSRPPARSKYCGIFSDIISISTQPQIKEIASKYGHCYQGPQLFTNHTVAP
jgi:hypothetical protein